MQEPCFGDWWGPLDAKFLIEPQLSTASGYSGERFCKRNKDFAVSTPECLAETSLLGYTVVAELLRPCLIIFPVDQLLLFCLSTHA